MGRLTGTRATHAYIYGLAVLAIASLAGWLYLAGFSFEWLALGAVGVLVPVGLLSRRFPMRFGRTTVDVADVATLTTLALFGPIWALLVAIPSALYRDRLRTLFVSSVDTLKVVAAGGVFSAFSIPLMSSSRFDARFVYGVLAAALVYYMADALLNSTLGRLKYGTPLVCTLEESFLPLVPANVAVVFTVLGTSYAAVVFGPAAAVVLFSGAAGALTLLHLLHDRQTRLEAAEDRAASLEGELLSSNLELANRFVESLGRKDGYTARHAAASAVYAADLAREFALEPATTEKLRVAALLQDAGLVSVTEEVLLTQPEKLNSVGRMHLEEHPHHGELILSAAPGYEEASKWVRWHHERVDGTGYPDKLRGEWIPVEAKILAAASEYAALILDGPGSAGLSAQEARGRLVGEIGNALDSGVVRTLLRVLDTEDERYATAADARFTRPSTVAVPDELKSGGEGWPPLADANQG